MIFLINRLTLCVFSVTTNVRAMELVLICALQLPLNTDHRYGRMQDFRSESRRIKCVRPPKWGATFLVMVFSPIFLKIQVLYTFMTNFRSVRRLCPPLNPHLTFNTIWLDWLSWNVTSLHYIFNSPNNYLRDRK